MNLYQITGELSTAIDLYNSVETDDELVKLEATLNSLQLSFDQKAVAVAKHILNTEADLTAIGEEIGRLVTLRDRAKKQSEWFRNYLFRSMQAVGTREVDGVTVKLKIKKNPPAVIIEDEAKISDKYKRIIPEKKEPDKALIKESWKAGIGVDGTRVEQSERLEIK